MIDTCAVIPAAGLGLRMGKGRPKQFLQVSGKSILERTLDIFGSLDFLSDIVVVLPRDHLEAARSVLESAQRAQGPALHAVEGGAERQDSVHRGLMALPARCEWVIVHDGVRPFASRQLIEATWRKARETGASIAALPATETVKLVVEGRVSTTIPREQVWLVQTPQVFRKALLLEAYALAGAEGWRGTDDASLVERMGEAVTVVHGERTNVKVTTPEDLLWGEWFLSRSSDG